MGRWERKTLQLTLDELRDWAHQVGVQFGRPEFRSRLDPHLPSDGFSQALRCPLLALSSASVARFQPYLSVGRYQASLSH
jgi:hypothetical protein